MLSHLIVIDRLLKYSCVIAIIAILTGITKEFDLLIGCQNKHIASTGVLLPPNAGPQLRRWQLSKSAPMSARDEPCKTSQI